MNLVWEELHEHWREIKVKTGLYCKQNTEFPIPPGLTKVCVILRKKLGWISAAVTQLPKLPINASVINRPSGDEWYLKEVIGTEDEVHHAKWSWQLLLEEMRQNGVWGQKDFLGQNLWE